MLPHRLRSIRRTAAAVVMAVMVAACQRTARHPAVGAVVVSGGLPAPELQALGMSREALRLETQSALRAAGFAIRAEGGAASGADRRAVVAVVEARPVRRAPLDGPAEAEELRMDVGVELRLERAQAEEDSVRETGQWSEPVRVGEPEAAAFRRAVRNAAERAAAALMLAMVEAGKPDADLIADLEAADSRVRDQAVRQLAERRNPVAVPALIARLQDPDPELVERAVGALAQIRDPRAVEPLIALSHRRGGPFVAQLAWIIGDIGGPDAEAYLLTLASGYPEPLVRQVAEQSLARTRQRRAEEPAVPAKAR